MISFTLKQLRYFEALKAEGHFGRAAEVCNISQPALSMQIKELEAQLGTPLFERGARQVRLTGFGEVFSQHASDVLRRADELSDMARMAQQRLIGRLRIGVIPTIAPYLLPKIIKSLTEHYEGLDIHVRETQTSKLLTELEAGKIDAAIVALPISVPTFFEAALFDEPFVLVRPKAQENLPIPSPEGLREMRLLLLEEGHCFRDQALSFCGGPQARPHIGRQGGLDASALSTLVQMVGAGLGVTLIPQMAVAVETRSADVAVTRFTEGEPKRTVGMIWRKTSPLAEQFGEVAELVKTAAM